MNEEEKQPDFSANPPAGEEENLTGVVEDSSETIAVESVGNEEAASELLMDLEAIGDQDPANPGEDAKTVAADPLANAIATIEALSRELEAVKSQLDERTQQCESFKNQYMRIAADFENFRKRTQRDKEELEEKAKRATLTELLPVVDNFERARSQIKPQNDGEWTIHKSYQSVYKQLADSLKRVGVSPMRSEGQPFDPNIHEAVLREATDEFPEGTVIEQLQRGYFLGERVLRHALVKVAAPPEPMISSEEDPPASES